MQWNAFPCMTPRLLLSRSEQLEEEKDIGIGLADGAFPLNADPARDRLLVWGPFTLESHNNLIRGKMRGREVNIRAIVSHWCAESYLLLILLT